MAQIRIEPRRSRLVWLWVIIALIIIAVIIWFIAGRPGTGRAGRLQPANAPPSLPTLSPATPGLPLAPA